jgi:DNA-binding GntR family transcriptional regulator
VRRALAELESEGLLHRAKGRGTFVAEPRSSSLWRDAAPSSDELVREALAYLKGAGRALTASPDALSLRR